MFPDVGGIAAYVTATVGVRPYRQLRPEDFCIESDRAHLTVEKGNSNELRIFVSRTYTRRALSAGVFEFQQPLHTDGAVWKKAKCTYNGRSNALNHGSQSSLQQRKFVLAVGDRLKFELESEQVIPLANGVYQYSVFGKRESASYVFENRVSDFAPKAHLIRESSLAPIQSSPIPTTFINGDSGATFQLIWK